MESVVSKMSETDKWFWFVVWNHMILYNQKLLQRKDNQGEFDYIIKAIDMYKSKIKELNLALFRRSFNYWVK